MEMKSDEYFDDLTIHYQVPANRSKLQAWEELHQKLELQPRKAHSFRLSWSFWSSVAAAVVLTFIILFSRVENEQVLLQEISSGIAQTQQTVLPDSTRIFMASNSSAVVSYSKNFRNRSVKLKGEAYFNVEKGKEFTVEFAGGLLSVLGTEFSVSAYDSSLVQISCSEGLVKVNIHDQIVLLSHGQGLKWYDGVLTGPFPIDSQLAKDQRNGMYYWNKISLEELMQLIGQKFNYQINCPELLKKRNFSGQIELAQLEESLLIVSLAMNFDYSIDSNQRTVQLNDK